MDKRLIWMIKSIEEGSSRKKLEALLNDENLYDESFIDTKGENYKKVMRDIEIAKKLDIKVVTYIDEAYPKSLKLIPNPPPYLFVNGNVEALSHPLFAGMVGSRESDSYGLRIASTLAFDIAQTGVGIVSGGAKGIDSASHEGALRANAPTVAVLGSGLDVLYPKSNKALFEKICEKGGAVISEFSFGEPPNKRNFPHRNRIIAALSEAVVVVRAGHRSGALITADRADSYGKAVFSVPGNIDSPLSAGVNALIRDGVAPCLCAMDVLDELILRNPDFFVKKETEQKKHEDILVEKPKEHKIANEETLSPMEKEVVALLKESPKTMDELTQKVSFDESRITAVLGMLELRKVIKKEFDKKYKLI